MSELVLFTGYNDSDELGAEISIGRKSRVVLVDILKIAGHDAFVRAEEKRLGIATEMFHRAFLGVLVHQIGENPSDTLETEHFGNAMNTLLIRIW